MRTFAKNTILTMLCLASALSGGCGSGAGGGTAADAPAAKQEKLLTEMMTTQDEIMKLLVSIKDEQSAKAAVSQADSIIAKLKSVGEQLKASGEISPQVKAKFEKLWEEKKSEMQSKVAQLTASVISNPKLIESIQPFLEKFAQLKDSGVFSK